MDQQATHPAASRTEIAADFAQLRAWMSAGPPSWTQAPDLFQTLDWFELLATHGFVDGVQPWLPWVSDPATGSALALPLMPAAGGLRSLSNYYSSLYGAVGSRLPSPGCWTALAQAMRQHPLGGLVDLHPLENQGLVVQALAPALRVAGYWVDRYACFGNWFLPITHASFEDYAGSLPSALRHGIARGRRRLQRAGGFGLHVAQVPGAGLEAAIADYETVYRQSWKSLEPCPSFMPELARMAARLGWLRLGVLHLQGQPIAAQVWLVHGGKANIYKLAYVQGFERFSPGSVLTAALMQHVIDVDKVCEVDYLTGDDAYKKDWMRQRRERIGLVAFHPLRPRGLLAAARHFSGKAWRRLRPAATRP
jgi:hypothetical protein